MVTLVGLLGILGGERIIQCGLSCVAMTTISGLEIAHTFRTQTDTVANDAIAKVHASGMSSVEQLRSSLDIVHFFA